MRAHDYQARLSKFRTYKLNLLPPEHLLCQNARLGNLNIQLTGCILPGQDPRKIFKKECQDNIKWIYYNNSGLAVLADGHGEMGRAISHYISRFFNEFFINNQQIFKVVSNIGKP